MAHITVSNLLAGAKGLRGEWLELAACGGRSRVMDPPIGARSNAARRRALAVCRSCPVLPECRAWALSLPPRMSPGWVVGGLTESQAVYARQRSAKKP